MFYFFKYCDFDLAFSLCILMKNNKSIWNSFYSRSHHSLCSILCCQKLYRPIFTTSSKLPTLGSLHCCSELCFDRGLGCTPWIRSWRLQRHGWNNDLVGLVVHFSLMVPYSQGNVQRTKECIYVKKYKGETKGVYWYRKDI